MNTFEIREIENGEDFNPSMLCEHVPFTQAGLYGDWQRNLGRTVKRFLVSSDTKIIAYFQIIKYPLLLGKSYLYIPYGPVTKVFSHEFFAYIKQELNKIAKINKAVFVRLDFTPPHDSKQYSL